MAIEKKFVREQINRLLIKEFVAKETERAGFGGLDIQRTPMGTRVSLVVERPGMVIGRRGATIQQLTADIASKFDAENPQIEVVEAGRNANLNASIMARKVAEALERGWHFRRAGHSTVRRIMESGAKGCIVILSGKLTGQRHRVQKFIAGHIKYNGDTALNLMDHGYSQCKRKLGVIGCTVRIMHPDARLPDEVTVYAPGEKELLAQAARRPERVEPVSERKEGEEKPAEAAPAEARKEGEEKPRGRSRRREPTPQPTEADIREAEQLAQRREAEKAAAKTGKPTEAKVEKDTAKEAASTETPPSSDVAETAATAGPEGSKGTAVVEEAKDVPEGKTPAPETRVTSGQAAAGHETVAEPKGGSGPVTTPEKAEVAESRGVTLPSEEERKAAEEKAPEKKEAKKAPAKAEEKEAEKAPAEEKKDASETEGGEA